MEDDNNYLDVAIEKYEDKLEELSKEECFKKGYLECQNWNTFPISNAIDKKSNKPILHSIKTRRRRFLFYEYDYFYAYFIEDRWIENSTLLDIEDNYNVKVVGWKLA